MSICLNYDMLESGRKPGRPKHCRKIGHRINHSRFGPRGSISREEIRLELDELEAIRLTSYAGLYHTDAAKKMNVSRQTLGRILKSAHYKIADSLLNGKILNIQGGNVQHQHQHHGEGSRGYCICPKCETKEVHLAGQPCQETICPKCGAKMLREGSEHHQQWMNRRKEK